MILHTRFALGSAAAPALVALLLTASPASAACGSGKPAGKPAVDCPNPPPLSATPELDSLALFGTGAAGIASYALLRTRAARRKNTSIERDTSSS